jgi:hypothetical protein
MRGHDGGSLELGASVVGYLPFIRPDYLNLSEISPQSQIIPLHLIPFV